MSVNDEQLIQTTMMCSVPLMIENCARLTTKTRLRRGAMRPFEIPRARDYQRFRCLDKDHSLAKERLTPRWVVYPSRDRVDGV
jgi:hypothetical protein